MTIALFPGASVTAEVRDAADMIEQLPTRDTLAKGRLATEGWLLARADAAGVEMTPERLAIEADAFDAAVDAELDRRLSGRNVDRVEHFADQVEAEGDAAWPAIRETIGAEMAVRARRLGIAPSAAAIAAELTTWEQCIRDELVIRREQASG